MVIEHGEVTVTVEGSIIEVKLKGAFNEFGARRYTVGVQNIVKSFEERSFSILINNLELLGGTPEAYEELERYNQWLNSQNLTAKAMVITSDIALDIINKFSPSRSLQNNKNFDNTKDAKTWLRSLNEK